MDKVTENDTFLVLKVKLSKRVRRNIADYLRREKIKLFVEGEKKRDRLGETFAKAILWKRGKGIRVMSAHIEAFRPKFKV